MKKIKMARGVTLTFEEGCNKYLENCRQRNLREGTINHYMVSILEEYLKYRHHKSNDDYLFCNMTNLTTFNKKESDASFQGSPL